MSFGKMNYTIQVLSKSRTLDAEGFGSIQETVLASAKAYREGRHGSTQWLNRTSFSEATVLFRLRRIPNLIISTDHLIRCEDELFEILSVEDVKGRKMYLEILAKEVKPDG